MTETLWIEKLKTGDAIFVKSQYGIVLTNVEKVTPTGRIKVGKSYFDIRGWEIGGDVWSRRTLREATKEAVLDYQRKPFIVDLARSADLLKITYEQAAEINKILNLGLREVE